MQKEMIVRICATCDKPLKLQPDGTQEGIYCCDEYYHEGACVDKTLPGQMTFAEHYTEDGDCYWTEWEPEFNEEMEVQNV